MSSDNKRKLYDALSQDYDMGSFDKFCEDIKDDTKRKKLYDATSNEYDYGDYESFSNQLIGTVQTKPKAKSESLEKDINVPFSPLAETAYKENTSHVVEDKSLKNKVDGTENIHVPLRTYGIEHGIQGRPAYDITTQPQKYISEAKQFADEEKRINNEFTPKPVVEASDIYSNYSNRFSLTERGKQLSDELAEVSQQIQNKYADEFLASDEYKALQKQYKGEELNKAANEAFSRFYSDKISKELEPYTKAYQKEAFSRYENEIARELGQYQEKERQRTKQKIASDVSSLSTSVDNQLEENHRKLVAKSGSGNNAMNALMGSRQYNTATAGERKSMGELEAARSLLEESQNIIDEAARKGKTNFVAGVGRGFADTAFNPETWSFGLTDMRDAKVLTDALDKFDRGETLTQSEQTLMDAAVANMATNAYYYSDLGRGYKAGMVSGQSVPFMLEFAINPVSASGSGIAKSILKYGMKKFGKSAVQNNAAKFAARLVGDAAAAAAMTGTSSAARVAAGTIERAGGNIQLDETGTGYEGRTGQMSTAEAVGKSFTSTFLENQSEMVFNAFKGIGPKIWKTAERHIPGGTAAIMDNAIMGKAGEIYRKIKSNPTLQEVAKRTQFHGLGEEYLEEVYNNFANIPLGEMTLEEATDLDNNIDTFLGLAPTSVAFGLLGLGGLAKERIQHRNKMKAAFGNMTRIERERLAKLEELAEKGGNEDIKTFIRETILDNELTPEEKKAEIEYAYNLAVGNAIDDIEATQRQEVAENHNTATQEGEAIYSEHNPEKMRRTVLGREVAEQKLLDAGLSVEDIESMKNMPVEERQDILNNMDDVVANTATDFFTAYDRETAMNEALDTAHEKEVVQAREMLNDIVLPNQTVTVVPLGMYGSENAQYGIVVSGIDANGNPTQSNGAVVTYPVQMVNGTPDFSTIDKANPIVAIPKSYTDAMVFSADEAFNGMLTAYQQDAAILEGTPIEPGAQFPIMADDGTMQDITVANITPTGESIVVMPDGKTVQIPMDELSSRKRNAELAPIMEESANEEEIHQQAVREAVTEGYSDEVKNLQPQAGERLVVDGRNAVIKEVAPDGLIIDFMSESGDIIGTDIVPLESYYDYKQSLLDTPQNEPIQNEPTENEGTTENVQDIQPEPVQSGQLETTYPTDENGEPAFLQMQPQQTVQLLTDTFAEDAPNFVRDRLTAAQKAAEKATKKSPKAFGFTERAKEISQIKQERENTAREVEYWQNVSSLISTEVELQPEQKAEVKPQPKAKTEPSFTEQAEEEVRKNQERLASMSEEEIAAAQAKVQENIEKGVYDKKPASRKRIRYVEQDNALGEASTPMEFVLREIATGRITFQWGDKGTTQGLGSHLGLSDSVADRQKLIWALSNDGYAPEVAAEMIHADMPAFMKGLVTDQDIFNMILDAFQYGSPSRMFEAAKQLNGNDIESQRGYEEDLERQAAEWEAEQNKMSVEDWTALVDIIEEELEYQYRTLTDEDINTIFEEIYNEEYGTGRNEAESAEGTQPAGNSERSNEVLPENEVDNETADGRSEVGTSETTQTDEQGGSVLSEQPDERLNNNLFSYFSGTIKDLINAARNQGSRLIKKVISPVNSKLIDELATKGVFIDNTYNHTIDNNAINHAINRHGSEKEKLSGQIPVTENDIENIADVIEHYDSIETAKNKRGQDNIIYKKNYPDGTTIYIEEIRTGRKELAMASIRKQKNGKLTDANRQATQISDLSPVSFDKGTQIISNEQIYTVEKRHHQKSNKDIFAVNFIERMERDMFLRAKQIAKEQGGYYSSFGKGGFIFDTEEQARAFGERVNTELLGSQIGNAIAAAEAEVNINPTEAQKEAGNYKMGHVTVDGMNITIENPKGSVRRGKDENGKEWESTMHYTYGYIRGTRGVDGDHIDIFLSDNPESGNVYVVDQINQETGEFDESKVMYGFNSMEEAREAYLSNYEKGWKVGTITEVSKEEFKEWIDSSWNKIKPFSEYKNVEAISQEPSEVEEQQPTEVNGYRKGDKVNYKIQVKARNSYDSKDDLKENGFVWNKETNTWDKEFASMEEYNTFLEHFNDVTYYGRRVVNRYHSQVEFEVEEVAEEIEDKQPTEVNGYRKGDKVYYKNEPATIFDFEPDGRPVLDTGMAPIMYEVGNWKDITPDREAQPKQPTKIAVAKALETKAEDKPAYGSQNKVVSTERYEELRKKMRAKLDKAKGNNLEIDDFFNDNTPASQLKHVEGISKNKEYGISKVKELFFKYNTDKQQKALAEKVFSLAEKIGFKVTFMHTDLGFNIGGRADGDKIQYSHIITLEKNKERLPDVLLHEVIHGCTVYAIDAYKNGELKDAKLQEAVESILDVYDKISNEKSLSGEYGIKNEKEMIAEIANPKFRDKLKSINLWDKLKQAIKKLFFFEDEKNVTAYKVLDDALNKLLDNFNMDLFNTYEREKEFNEADWNFIELNNTKKYDPELVALGAEMAAYHVEAGARKFVDFAKRMLVDMGEDIRPYLKLFYNSVRDFPGMESYEAEMTPYNEVKATDINNIKLTEDEQTEANTETIVSETEAVASEAESRTEEAETTEQIEEVNEQIDKQIEKLNEQLSALDYINTLHSGMRVILKDGRNVMLSVVMHTGEQIGAAQFSKPYVSSLYASYKGKMINFAPEDIDIDATISYNKKNTSVGDLFTNENDVSLQSKTIEQTENDQKRRSKTENLEVGTKTQQEDARPVGERVDTGSRGSVGTDKFGSGRTSGLSPVKSSGSTGGKRNERNNRNERGIDYAPKSPKARFDANVRAIKLMRQLVASEEVPSREQMEVLRKFSGWGGLGTFFNNEDSAEYKKLRDILSDEEFDAAANSINSAYYTPANIIDSLWDIAGKLGFKGGNILEGSAGIGNIIGSMPVSIAENSNIEAVEIDPVTGNILKLLYPDAKVNIQGFEDTRVRNGSVDLAITNVPFVTGLQVHDPIDKDLSRKFRNIHDFCIAKNVRKLREGGIGIFITSSGTMDKSTALREWLVNEGNADFIGAFRLNNKTFEGASVTSDIIIIRKREGKAISPAAIDAVNSSIVRTGEYPTGETIYDKKSRTWVPETKKATMELNNYFQQHPENMAGEMAFSYEKGETRFPGSSALFPAKGKNQDTMLTEWANSFQPIMEKNYQPQQVEDIETEEKNGALFVDEKGNFYVSEMGVGVPVNINANKVRGYEKTECLRDYNTLKSALDAVLQYQVNNQDDKGLEPLLKKLNEAYDTFTSKYGSLNKNTSISFLRNDVDFPSIAAVEEYKEYKNAKEEKVVDIKKTNVFSGRVIGFQSEPQPKTVKDGVIASIYKFGHIDLDYIAEKLGKTSDKVKQTILNEGIGFVNPETGAVEVRYEYLSGNVRRKLQQAKENNQDGEFTENIKELEKVMPLDIPAHLIDFSLGSSWIDPQLYAEYIKEKFGVSDVSIHHLEGLWNLKVSGERNEKNRSEGVFSELFNEVIYGTELVDAALNNKTIQVKKVKTNYDKTKETIVDKVATQSCLTRIQEIKEDFKEWMHNKMLQDEELATKVAKVYNEKFNNIVPKQIDEMFLPKHFGGSSESVNLYLHQKRAVIRGTTEPLLLAHEVGSGKTFTLISTAMEMRRLGTAKKPMIVVQNATVGQFIADAKKLYPNARVLTITEGDRTPEGRRAFYGRIKYSDWDMIIVPQSTFDMIPDSPERQLTFIQEKIDEKQHALEVMQEIEGDENQIRQLENELADLQSEYVQTADKVKEEKQPKKRDRKREEKSKQNITARIKEQLDRKVDEVQYFDEMGIDAILVDEAHEYKRLGFSTAMTRGVKGIDPAGSKKAAGVYLKTRAVLEQNGWKNVIFATGTPISNTAAEIWTFMRYLMPKDILKDNEIYYFDDFVRNFGAISQSLEFSTSGKFKENTRFAAYINKPELIRLWSSVSDTVLTKDIDYVNDKIPRLEKDSHQDIFLPQSDSLVSIMNAVRAELQRFEEMTGKEKRENSHIPLTMYGIAKRAAIDTRLVDANAPDDPLSKTNKAVEETLRSLEETKDYKGTVAIFCDNQRRWDGKKVGFDLFEDLRDKLIAKGVPANQIFIMKPGMSVAKKQKVFDEVNAGSVRVIIGNTQTLGTGVNIQERLHTLIHMDAPDRPMDYTQRNGRILRQGNLHKVWDKPVRILRFGVEDSLDVTSYQRLKTKAGFIDSIMDGKAALANNQENRTLEEEEEGLFDNPVAILSGSQYALLKNQAEREYRKFLNKKNRYETDQIYVTNKLAKNKQQIEVVKEHIEDNRKKLAKAKELFPDGSVKVVTIEGHKCRNEQEIEDTLKEYVNKKVRALEEVARKDSYFRTQSLAYKLKFDGTDVTVKVSLTREENYDYKLKATRITVRRGVTYDIPAMGIKDSTAPGGYVKNAIDDITKNVVTGKAFSDAIDILTTSVTSMEEENSLLNERKGKPFEFGEELEAAKQKVDEYSELMKAELAEKEEKYAGRGQESNIDLSEIESEEEQETAPEEEVRFRTDVQTESGFETETIEAIHEEAAKLNVPVTVYTSMDQIPQGAARRALEKGLRVKGWYQNGHINVYLPNAAGMEDVKATLLHEGVAHYGLRKMLGEQNFNSFLDAIYAQASKEVRKEIVNLLPKYNYNMREATEEYLATMAEKGINNPTLWEKIKQLFRTMLEKVGYNWEITDNDLRYLLWESRNNLAKSNNPLDVAKETMMRNKLGIGMFGTQPSEETRFRFEERSPLVQEYDSIIKSKTFQFMEAFVTDFYAVDAVQRLIIKDSGKPIRTFENASTAHNRLSSINKEDHNRYIKDFYKPLIEQIKSLAKKSSRDMVETYIYAKSGLARNEKFLNRDAERIFNDSKKELDAKLEKNEITQAQYDTLMKLAQEEYDKFINEGGDYSGLTGLVLEAYEEELDMITDKAARDKREKEIRKTYKEHAENVVFNFESTIPAAEVDKLWSLIKAATDEILRIQLESGMISREKYEELKNYMEYYVPLKGWKENVAEDYYDYSRTESPVQREKKAKGRWSLADNPIASIALSAQSAIILGNRNKMKQRFFNFIVNRPNELVTIRDVWYEKTNNCVFNQREPVYPDIKETDDAEMVQQKLETFEENMQEKEKQGLAHRKRLPLGLELNFKGKQKQEHIISVMINGQEYVMYVNGSPRVAQAINGLTNSEAGEKNFIKELYFKAKRAYGAGLTSYNINFVLANFVRDFLHSSLMTYLEKGFIPAAKFVINVPTSAWYVGRGVLDKYNPDSKNDKYFQEFIRYGGETGYTAVHTLEDYKKEYEKAIKEVKGLGKVSSYGKKSLEGIKKALELVNRIAEDTNRFNAYKSSRQSGLTIEESIDAAKNITVNFNRKGAGSRTKGPIGALAGFLNAWILFFNPSVQGIYQIGKTAVKNKRRVLTTMATIMAAGYFTPLFNEWLISAIGGDDDDDYFYQNDYTRMNNWMIYIGNGYLKIPLPPFFREIYGMGDIFYRLMTNRITPERAAYITARQIQSALGVINLLPEDKPSIKEFFGSLVPDLGSPLVDIMLNRDFTGRPIAKDYEWNKYLPEYERIYKGVNPVYVEFSRLLNDILGGDDAKKTTWLGDYINPAYMEHLITQYTGGIGKTISDISGIAADLATGDTDNIELRNIPIVNRFVSPVTEQSISAAVNRVFYEYLDRYETMKVAEKRYKQFIKDGQKEYDKELEQMKTNGSIQFLRYFDFKMKILHRKQNLLKENPNNKDLEQQIVELKSEMCLKAKEILEGNNH